MVSFWWMSQLGIMDMQCPLLKSFPADDVGQGDMDASIIFIKGFAFN